LTRSSRRDIATQWALGAELADCAARMISEAAADRDAKARARLLAGTNHTLTHDVLGTFLRPDVEARDAAELARTLAEIDEPDTDPP
jgi:hypothetical protein